MVQVSGTEPPLRGTKELLDLYSKSPWLRAVTHKIGRAVAETHWQVFVARNRRRQAVRDVQLNRAPYPMRDEVLKARLDKDEVEELRDHPLLELLCHGNDQMLGMNVMSVTQNHLDLVGEAFWLLERGTVRQPIGLWPIPPHWIMSLPTRTHPFFKLRGKNAQTLEVPVTEMVHFRDPNPADPYGRGSGQARALGDELEIDEYAAKHSKAFFYNRARPDMIVYGDNISEADTKRLEQQWLGQHQGFWKSFRPLFFSRKIEVKELGQNMEQLQMVPLRKHERDTILQIYGGPPEKWGLINDSKRSTIVAADLFFQQDLIKPRVELIRASIQRHLVPQFDDKLIFHYHTPVVKDEEMQFEHMKAAPFSFTINDWRKRAGFASLGPEGDKLLVPLNSQLQEVPGGKAK